MIGTVPDWCSGSGYGDGYGSGYGYGDGSGYGYGTASPHRMRRSEGREINDKKGTDK